jgi:segregation and condensation protein B
MSNAAESLQDNVVSFAPSRSAGETQTSFNRELYDGPEDRDELRSLIEALLLVSPGPTTVAELSAGSGAPEAAVEAALADLDQDAGRGWMVQRHGARLQLVTAPRFAAQVRRFLGLDRESKLSPAALETLAIVAYQQPVTKSEIEGVRGVDCSGVLATLHTRGLVEQVGRLATAGNPIQYGTTPDFLQHFGLRSLADLPSLGRVGDQDAGSMLDAAVAAAGIDAMLGAESSEQSV